jgi:hypothetical protein
MASTQEVHDDADRILETRLSQAIVINNTPCGLLKELTTASPPRTRAAFCIILALKLDMEPLHMYYRV